MTNATEAKRPSRRFLRNRSEIAFIATSVIWAAVIIDTGATAWPLAMWMTTALIPFSLYRHRTDSAEPDSPTGTPT
jgi:membrane protease YdiL (CAAX protease family)